MHCQVRTHSLSKRTDGAISGGNQGFPEEGKEAGDPKGQEGREQVPVSKLETL